MQRLLVLILFLACSTTAMSCGRAEEAPRATSAAPGGAAACVAPEESDLGLALLPQRTSMWCWAASAQMVMRSLHVDIPQCKQANARFNMSNCCDSPTPDDCVNGEWPDFPQYGFSAKRTTDTGLSWDELRRQIGCRKVPVAFTWRWTGGGGHMMVASGYAMRDGVPWVVVRDPWPVDIGGDVVEVPYDIYLAGDDHTHWDDFYDVTPTQTVPHAAPGPTGKS